MLTALGAGENDESIVLVGLTDEDIKKMTDGSPIVLTRKTHGKTIPDGLAVCIFFGRTSEELVEVVKDLWPNTQETIHK